MLGYESKWRKHEKSVKKRKRRFAIIFGIYKKNTFTYCTFKDARDQETKRRQDGKMMQHTRDQMEDQRNKQHFAKIKKEKREDEEHRRKIKEQIARDRAEQMAARQAAKQRKSDSSSTSPRPR